MRIITLALFVVGLSVAPAFAQPAGSAAGSGSAIPETGSALPSVPTAPATIPGSSPQELRKLCTDAMNANPTLAKDVVTAADKQAAAARDQATIQAHTEAQVRIAKNERHVLLAYIAMWVVAALFVLFLWMRQRGLKAEIAQLRRDLDAAAKGSP